MNDKIRFAQDLMTKVGMTCTPAPSPAKNVVYIEDNKQNKVHALYYRTRNGNYGYWGITDNTINDLNASGVDYTVLLVSNEKVYMLGKRDMYALKACTLPPDGDYRVTEKDLRQVFNPGVYTF